MTTSQPFPEISPAPLPWYAIRTRSNHENSVAAVLKGKNLDPYVPSVRSVRRWSDRTVELNTPLLPGYVLCRFSIARRLPVLTTPGVVSILGFGSQPASIPDVEVEAIRQVLSSGLGTEPCPFLREGQRIRITAGSLEGVEGILLNKKSAFRLVVSIELLQRSISVEVDSHFIESISC